MNNKTIICGHRGNPVEWPENTIPSILSVAMSGIKAIEVDLCITRDDVVVLWHDHNPGSMEARAREAGMEPNVRYKPFFPATRNIISSVTYDELKKHYGYVLKSGFGKKITGNLIPTLEEFFSYISKYKLQYIFLDLKPNNLNLNRKILSKVLETYKEHKLEIKIIIESFNKTILDTLVLEYPEFEYALDVSIPHGFSFFTKQYSAFLKSGVHSGVLMRPVIPTFGGISSYKRIVKNDIKLRDKYPYKKLICATIDNKNEIKFLSNLGVDFIQTNYPKLFMESI